MGRFATQYHFLLMQARGIKHGRHKADIFESGLAEVEVKKLVS